MTSRITYEQYERALASMVQTPGTVRAWGIPAPLTKFVASIKEDLMELAKDIGCGLLDLVKALANRDAFALLRSIKFNLAALIKGLRSVLALLPRGLNALFHELRESGLLDKLKDGSLAVDIFLNNYPILKKLAGPALAALLFWMWTQASFIGDPWTDFDLSTVGAALTGHYSVHDLFTTEAGLTGLTLFIAGVTTGIGVAWLGETTYNAILALAFSAARKFAPSLSRVLKAHIPKFKTVR